MNLWGSLTRRRRLWWKLLFHPILTPIPADCGILQRAVTFILYEQIEVVFFFLPIIWQLGLYLKAFCVSFCMCSNVYQESFGLVHRFPSQCDVTARMFYLVVTQRTIYLHMPNFSVSCDEMEKLNLIVLSDSGSLCDWELMKHLCWSPAVS